MDYKIKLHNCVIFMLQTHHIQATSLTWNIIYTTETAQFHTKWLSICKQSQVASKDFGKTEQTSNKKPSLINLMFTNNKSTIMMTTKTMFPNWKYTLKMQNTVVWLEMAGWTLWPRVISGSMAEPWDVEATGAQTELEWLCMLRWFSLLFVCDQQHNQNVSTHCNSSSVLLCSPMIHLRLYITVNQKKAPKLNNMRLGSGWDIGIRERKSG